MAERELRDIVCGGVASAVPQLTGIQVIRAQNNARRHIAHTAIAHNIMMVIARLLLLAL